MCEIGVKRGELAHTVSRHISHCSKIYAIGCGRPFLRHSKLSEKTKIMWR